MTKKIWDFRNFRERKKKDQGGYSLVELMVVIVIMVILASVSIGVYNGYVERAKNAVAYEKGHRLSAISGDLMKKPNDPDSLLYEYVGEDTDDCTDFTVSLKKIDTASVEIQGFTYTADTYEITWTEDDGVEVTMK